MTDTTLRRHMWSRSAPVSNLPYNVATPLVADLLDTVPAIGRFVVMVQKEVAQRLAAQPGSAEYGAISVKVAYWGSARILGDVPPSVFVPRPKVTSSIIEITRSAQPAVGAHMGLDITPQQLFTVVRTAFGQRRKMLRRSLAAVADAEVFSRADIDPELRPEQLDVHQWGRLAHAITTKGSGGENVHIRAHSRHQILHGARWLGGRHHRGAREAHVVTARHGRAR